MALVYGKLIGRSLPQLRALRTSGLVSPNSCFRSGVFLGTRHTRSYADVKLNLPALDKKWREEWAEVEKKVDQVHGKNGKDSKYVLPMFPYPSGYLHLGHLRVYTIADAIARFQTLQGHDVILPMGWDAFGLPAENAAIERGINPATWTRSNIARMKEQLDAMNGSWDWSRELATCDESFYKHTQKIFLLLHEKGLAYQTEAEVNYDPVDKTVLANEQVDANGCSWRSGAKVEKRWLKQWFLKISEFRDELLQDLETLVTDDAWPERVLTMQKNWLGKSHGAMIKFPVMAFNQGVGAAIEVFTTRPDTLFGVQYLALASTHPVVQDLAKNDPELQAFLDTLPGLPPDSKVGYLLPHLRVVNPLAYHENTLDETKKSIPVYVAPYVLGDYGEGAVMGVPGHDLRDHAFWTEHGSGEPVRVVLAASEHESTTAMLNEPFVDHGIMNANSGPYQGRQSLEAGQMLVAMLELAGLAKSVEKWRLRDWLISRQRYWGAPIPVIHCTSCGTVPVPDEQLPVKLPEVDAHWAERKAGNPLETLDEWVNCSCPKCGGAAKRDTDTMDTFVDSSWYYMRFIDPQNENAPFSAEKARSLLPVDLYIGGVEHAILHLLYARFIYKFLMTTSLVNESGKTAGQVHEPFKRLITQGMVHGKTYTDPINGRYLKPDELELSDPKIPKVAASGLPAYVSFEKMSKSKYNGVDPTETIAKYGSDATRAHMIFQAPVSEVLLWDEDKISGVTRWLARVHDLVTTTRATKVGPGYGSVKESLADRARNLDKTRGSRGSELPAWDADTEIWRDVQKTITSVTASYQRVYSLNTVVSDLMSLTNTIVSNKGACSNYIRTEALLALIRMVAPITPAFAEECWSTLRPAESSKQTSSIFQDATFPVPDGSLSLEALQPRRHNCAVQVNGKFRFAVDIPKPPAELLGQSVDGPEKAFLVNALQGWITAQITKEMEKDESKRKKFGKQDVATAKKVHVVQAGKLVNFVF